MSCANCAYVASTSALVTAVSSILSSSEMVSEVCPLLAPFVAFADGGARLLTPLDAPLAYPPLLVLVDWPFAAGAVPELVPLVVGLLVAAGLVFVLELLPVTPSWELLLLNGADSLLISPGIMRLGKTTGKGSSAKKKEKVTKSI